MLGVDAEFGFVVRGTTDVDHACLELARHRILNPLEEDSEALRHGLHPEDLQTCEEDVERSVALPPVTRVGWFRWNPCSPRSCGEGHRAHLDWLEEPNRGAWQGVLFAA